MTNLKKKIVDARDDFMGSLNRQKKLGALIIGGVVIIFLSVILVVPIVQANIRSSQIYSLIDENIDSKKVAFLEYKTQDSFISKQKGITVLFSQPNIKQYAKIINLLQNPKKTAEFNRGIYIYPIVYDVKDVEKKYSIKATEPTLVFFEEGKETNRMVITEDLELDTIFIPEFNRLPSGLKTVVPVVTPPAATNSSAANTEATTPQSVAPEEIPQE